MKKPAFPSPRIVRLLALAAVTLPLSLGAQESAADAAPSAGKPAKKAPAVHNPSLEESLDPLVVTSTASRTLEEVRRIPESVTIVDSATIERHQSRTPIEMLKEQPGIWGVNVPAQGSPILRGQIGNRVLYLWDGVRINNGALFSGPNGFFNQFPVGAVDRIDVVRGAGSVQYGSDAIGGVINLLPKKAFFTDQPDFGGSLYSRYGSNDGELTETLDFHASSEKFAFAGGLTWQDVGDYHGPGEGKLDSTGFEAFGGYADLAWRPVDNQTLRLSWIHNRREDVESYVQSKLNASGIPRIFGPHEERGIVKLDYTLTQLGSWSDEFKIYGYYQYYDALRDRLVESGTAFNNTTTDTDQQVWGLGLQNTVESGKLKLVYGTDYRTEDLATTLRLKTTTKSTGASVISEPAGNTPDGTYDVFDAFATLSYQPVEALVLTLGGRFEHTHIDSSPVLSDVIPSAGYDLDSLELDKTWDSFTWNAGAVYSFTPCFDLAANVGSGFRAPTYSDLLSAGTPVFSTRIASIPSPDLDPEKTLSVELGPRWHSERFSASLAGYYTHLDDLVVSTTSGTVTIPGQGVFDASVKSNDGKGYVTGVELAMAWQLADHWTLFGNATYTYGEDTASDVPLRFIPPLNGTLGLRYDDPSGRWWVELAEVMAARLTRHAPNDEQDAGFSEDPGYGSPSATNPPLRSDFDIPGFAVTNLRGGVRVWNRGDSALDLTLSLNNLFNTRYREAYAQQQLVAPGFGAVVGARLSF